MPERPPTDRNLVLALGNTILSDDGIAIHCIRRLKARWEARPDVVFLESSEAGLALLDLLIGFQKVLIFDALPAVDGPYGQVVEIPQDQWENTPLASSPHYTGLPSLLEMGRQLNYEMPSVVRVFGITVKDPFTLGESLSPELQEKFETITHHIHAILRREFGTGT